MKPSISSPMLCSTGKLSSHRIQPWTSPGMIATSSFSGHSSPSRPMSQSPLTNFKSVPTIICASTSSAYSSNTFLLVVVGTVLFVSFKLSVIVSSSLLEGCFAHADIEPVAGIGDGLELADVDAGGGGGRTQRLDVESLPALHRRPSH